MYIYILYIPDRLKIFPSHQREQTGLLIHPGWGIAWLKKICALN